MRLASVVGTDVSVLVFKPGWWCSLGSLCWSSDLSDVDRWQGFTGRVSAGGDLGDHGRLWRYGARHGGPHLGLPTSSTRPLYGDGTVWSAAGAGRRPPSDESNFHGGVRSATQPAVLL